MNTIFTPTIKRYALSSATTFLTTFLTVLALNVQNINGTTFTYATVASLFLIAARAGVKAVLEAVVGGHADLPSITTPVPVQTTGYMTYSNSASAAVLTPTAPNVGVGVVQTSQTQQPKAQV